MLLYPQNTHPPCILPGGTAMDGPTSTRPLWATPHLRITFIVLCLFAPSSPLVITGSQSHNCALPRISSSAETDDSIE